MEAMTRRALFGASAAGVVGVLLDANVPLAAKQDDDPIGDHILREGQRHAKALANGGGRHETLAGISSNLRLHAAHLRATKTEDKVAKAIRKALAKRGRSGLLDDLTSPDVRQKHHDDMVALGLEDLHVPERESSRADFDQALTALSAPGSLSASLEQMADAVDDMNARTNPFPHALAIRFVEGQIDGYCNIFNNVCHFLALFTPIICVLAGAGGQIEFIPVCALLTVETATACFISWLCS
jgi:hypothetical protein